MERTRRITPNREVRDVASRREALESLRSTILGSKSVGPMVLITGEAGAGKTRLWSRLAEETPAGWRFAVVAVAPAVDPVDFLALTAAQLGLVPSERVATNRLEITATLQDETADGRSWVLVVDNAHHATPEVWTEIEALTACGGPGEAGCFAAVLLVGRTELARRFAGRSFQTLANRMAGHVHLPPLDVEEAAQLLASVRADRPVGEIERWHRDAAGNPRALLRMAEVRGPSRADSSPARSVQAAEPSVKLEETRRPPTKPVVAVAPAVAGSMLDAPPLVPSRPPLREEEGLIEVGWSGSLDAEEGPMFDAEQPNEVASVATAPLGDESIEDRYAALQAWTEWARNRDRLNPTAEATDDRPQEVATFDSTAEDDEARDVEDDSNVDLGAGVRAEGEHDHAPYSQLFSRLKQSN